jgi:hypothetical protein
MQVAVLSCTKSHSFQVMSEGLLWGKEVTLALAPYAGQHERKASFRGRAPAAPWVEPLPPPDSCGPC